MHTTTIPMFSVFLDQKQHTVFVLIHTCCTGCCGALVLLPGDGFGDGLFLPRLFGSGLDGAGGARGGPSGGGEGADGEVPGDAPVISIGIWNDPGVEWRRSGMESLRGLRSSNVTVGAEVLRSIRLGAGTSSRSEESSVTMVGGGVAAGGGACTGAAAGAEGADRLAPFWPLGCFGFDERLELELGPSLTNSGGATEGSTAAETNRIWLA